MAYFQIKEYKYTPRPIPSTPSYIPPSVPTPTPTEQGSTPHIVIPTFTGDTSIIFYITQDERNRINKTLGNAETFNITIKENVSVINPTIKIQTNIDLSYYNYMYITNVKRYYFIENVEMLQGGLFSVSCSCDVLMSFKDDILNITGIVEETATDSLAMKNLPNRHYVNDSGKNIKIVRFQNKPFFETPKNIIITCGKSSDEAEESE